MTRLVIEPADPVQNYALNPVTVTVTLGSNEAVQSGNIPDVAYLLSGAGRMATALDSLYEVATETGDAQTWEGTLLLPADAGQSDPESLQLPNRL